MVEKNMNEKKLKADFYDLKIKDILNECEQQLDIIEKKESIDAVMYKLQNLEHIWVVDNKNTMTCLGIIARKDLLHILAPPRSIYHIFSLPESYHHGTIGDAEDIMDSHFTTCNENDKIVDVLKKMIRHTSEKIAILSSNENLTGEINLKMLIHHYLDAKRDSLHTE